MSGDTGQRGGEVNTLTEDGGVTGTLDTIVVSAFPGVCSRTKGSGGGVE